MYHDMQMMVWNEGGELIPMFYNFLDGATKKVRGFKAMPAYELGAYRAPRAIWLES
jgi:peptide/nickel transport system substrate-binding protein